MGVEDIEQLARDLWESGKAADLFAARKLAENPANWPLDRDEDALPPGWDEHPMR